MHREKGSLVESTIGRLPLDSSGSPVGVVHLDPGRSYSGIGSLLQRFLNDSDSGAWEEIKSKINYTYEGLNFALGTLEKETGFSGLVKSKVASGQKLLFKPNLVNPFNINPQTHGPDMGSTTCTEWPFMAALMRWFHDRIDIRYHQMALGEAATCMPAAAALLSRANPGKLPITPEAVIEGKSGDFYGGWGFYFVRQYLKEMLPPEADDDPFKGYEESLSGIYLPPGLAGDQLMVYDLNRIFDDPGKGREVAVPDGVNFQSILGYLEAVDRLTGSSWRKEFLEAFDENQDGIVAYEEYGRKWIWGFLLNQGGHYLCQVGKEEWGYLRGLFQTRAGGLKCADPQWSGGF